MADTELSPERVEEIRARLAAATQRPWRTVTNRPRGPWADRDCIPLASDGHPVLTRNWKEACLNAAFIAHAPDDIDDLLADRDRLLRENAELRAGARAECERRNIATCPRCEDAPCEIIRSCDDAGVSVWRLGTACSACFEADSLTSGPSNVK